MIEICVVKDIFSAWFCSVRIRVNQLFICMQATKSRAFPSPRPGAFNELLSVKQSVLDKAYSALDFISILRGEFGVVRRKKRRRCDRKDLIGPFLERADQVRVAAKFDSGVGKART